jgi:hypothetical protein
MEVEYRHPKIYFIAGKARHGKTTTGLIIKEEYEKRGQKAITASYGKYIKDYAKMFFNWDGKEETKPRELLQQLGTDIIRKKLKKEEIFINRMIEDIEIMSYFFDAIIIDDARFEKEIDKPKSVFDNVLCIKVVRDYFDTDLTSEQQHHATETGLDNYDKFDYCIHNNGSIDDLRKQLITIINKEEHNEKNE